MVLQNSRYYLMIMSMITIYTFQSMK